MKQLPTVIQTFERLITEDRLYVDKTEIIYELITTGSVYFLSRPRRFGKSLLVSTLKSLFEGKRDLFTNLWLGQQSDYNFEPYHVIHLDMSQANTEDGSKLKQFLHNYIKLLANQYGITLLNETYNTAFGELIEKLGRDKAVVILIDEYDKPLLDNLTKPARDEIM